MLVESMLFEECKIIAGDRRAKPTKVMKIDLRILRNVNSSETLSEDYELETLVEFVGYEVSLNEYEKQ